MSGKFISYNQEKLTKNLWIYFSLVVIINIIIKSIQLGFSSFWYDEIVSVQSAYLDFGHIKHVSEWDNNPPFYYYCLSVWLKLFNDSEFSVRFLSVLFSSFAGGVLFLFANKYFNKYTAFFVSLIFISNNLLFFYSHEARAYSLVLFLAMLSTLLYFDLKEKSGIITVLTLGLVNFLLIYSHYISGLVLIIQFILMLFYFDKKQKMSYLYSSMIVLVLVLVRFTKKQFLLIIDFNKPGNTFWLKKSEFSYLKEVLSNFLFNDVLAIFFLTLIIFISVFLIIKKNKEVTFQLIYSLLAGLGAILTLYFLGKKTPIFLDRYLIFTLPFLFILIAFALSFIKFKYVSWFTVLFFTLFFIPKIEFKTDKKMDYKNAVKFIRHFKTKKDLIIVKTIGIKPLFCHYYDPEYLKLKKENLPDYEQIIFCTAWEDVHLDVTKFKRVVVLDSFQDYNMHEADFVLRLSEKKKKIGDYNGYKGVRISFYQ